MRRSLAAAVATLGLLTCLSACSSDQGPASVLRSFLAGWPSDKVDGVGFVDTSGNPVDPSVVATQMKSLAGDLDLSKIKVNPSGDPKVQGTDATADVDVKWTVSGNIVWSYTTSVRLKGGQDTWRIVWSPSTLNQQLQTGDKIAVKSVAAGRGQILDGAGAPIVQARPVVIVGIEPKLVKNQASLLAALDAAFKSVKVDVDLSGVPAELAAAKPDAFVEIVTLRRDVYDSISAKIHDLDGTVFRESTLQLAPSHDFARALLGTVGDVTKEQMDAHPGVYVVGEQVGQAGLEAQYDALLRGSKGVQVAITGRGTQEQPQADVQLFSVAPKAGQSLSTTLDQKVQNAADAALAGQTNPSALVAIRISDGHILAVANGPNGGGVNLAFTAAVPPGSTFKMVTALAALTEGKADLNTVVPCPKGYTVNGRTFANSGGFELGNVPLHVDFAKSCNTAFAYLGNQLTPTGLQDAAAQVGIGTNWNPGTECFTGSVQANAAPVDAAAAAFGQGQTLVSPIALGGAVAAVARGSWKQPVLFTALPAGAPAPSAGPSSRPVPPDGTTIDANAAAALHTMMREVVTGGTAHGLLSVPGGPVMAKTGTAEYDNNPAHTHIWTIGWQGDIAFVTFVQNGGVSAGAVTIAANFLKALAS
jgi:cell division protein FtsI/penicillin-binding protein 2